MDHGTKRGRLYPTYAVIGCGNGGQALAGYLAWRGFTTILYNRTPDRLLPITHSGSIQLSGCISGHGRPIVTDNIADATSCDVLLITIPATGHADLAITLAPHLRSDQIIVLHPGRTGGALEFKTVLVNINSLVPIIAETESLIFACRTIGPSQSHIYAIKHQVPLAALPAHQTATVLRALRLPAPQFVPADNVLATSLMNVGALLHPAPTLLNLSRITSDHQFKFYRQGITPVAARVITAMDKERLAIAEELGLSLPSLQQWLYNTYHVTGNDLYQCLQNNPAYEQIMAPDTISCRYLHEDVPTGLVPMAELAEFTGVSAPTINSIIDLAAQACAVNFRDTGRTLARLGLTDLTISQVVSLVSGHCTTSNTAISSD